MKSETTKGFLYIIIATLLWGMVAPIAKYLFNIGITPNDLVQARVTFSLLILSLFFLGFRKDLLVISSKDIGYFLLLGVGGFALVQFTYLYTISLINVGVAIALQYTAPSMIVIYSFLFLGKKIAFPTIAGILLALLGCYLVVGAYQVAWADLNWAGIISGLLSAVVYAFYTLYSEKGLKKYPAWTVFFYAVLFAALFWNIVHPPFNLVGQGWHWKAWTGIMAVAILGTLIPFALFFMALQKLDPIRLTVTCTLEPIFATIMAFLTLGEQMNFWQIIGGLLIIASIILMTFDKPKRTKETTTLE